MMTWQLLAELDSERCRLENQGSTPPSVDKHLGNSWFIPSHTRVWPEGTTILLNSNLAVEIHHLVMDISCFISRLICSAQILQFAMTNVNVKKHFIIPWWMLWNLTRTSLLLMMFHWCYCSSFGSSHQGWQLYYCHSGGGNCSIMLLCWLWIW